MRDFSFHIHDDRYSVPTLEFVTASSEGRARELANERRGASKHRVAVDVHEGDRLLFRGLDDDGRYRVADDPELATLSERYPAWVRIIRVRGAAGLRASERTARPRRPR